MPDISLALPKKHTLLENLHHRMNITKGRSCWAKIRAAHRDGQRLSRGDARRPSCSARMRLEGLP